jgi:hypothetical protein
MKGNIIKKVRNTPLIHDFKRHPSAQNLEENKSQVLLKSFKLVSFFGLYS